MKQRQEVGQGYRKASVITLIFLVVCSMCATGYAFDETSYPLTRTYSFTPPQIQTFTIDNQQYSQVSIPDAEGAWDPGEPNLPAYAVSLLLPAGTRMGDISVQPGCRTVLGYGFFVEPTVQPVALTMNLSAVAPGVPDPEIYSSDEPFPGTLFTVIGTYSFRGYSILYALLYPVQYRPLTGELSYYSDITVSIHLVQTGQINPLYRGFEDDQQEAVCKVDNPEAAASYEHLEPAPVASDAYKLLILTTNEFKDGFLPLKAAHDAEGLPTEIMTLSDISPLFGGDVTAEDIRAFVKDEYITAGIDYVLIGGDSDVVPAKGLWVEAWSGGDRSTMPSDLYYGCLDGTYNYNGDDHWGEPHDGDNGGDVDLLAEVYVGRACVGSLDEVNNFVQKTLTYMDAGGYSNGTSLMVGEYLWGPPDNPVTFGGDSMDELVNGSNAHFYTTVGIPASQYTIQRLYDKTWPGFDVNDSSDTGWPTSEIVQLINSGPVFVNHLGHSSTTYNMRMVPADAMGLNNTVLPFIYSQGCYAGAFDDDDCMAEYFTVKTVHAAFAVVMCARYGWGTPGSTDGPSQRFQRYFWDAVFGENITVLGKANQDSKEENVNRINAHCIRWCYYEMNLFGDPSLEFFSRNNSCPMTPSTPTGVSSGEVGLSYTFSSSAIDVDGDSLYYKWSFGDGTFSPWLGPFPSGVEVNVSHNWSRMGNYLVTVKARDMHLAESDWSASLPVKMPYVYKYFFLEPLLHFVEQWFPRVFRLLQNHALFQVWRGMRL